jgi:hypothetical protein
MNLWVSLVSTVRGWFRVRKPVPLPPGKVWLKSIDGVHMIGVEPATESFEDLAELANDVFEVPDREFATAEEYLNELFPPTRRGPEPGKARGPYVLGRLKRDVSEHIAIILSHFETLAIRGTKESASHKALPLVAELLPHDFMLWEDKEEGGLKARMEGGDKYSKLEDKDVLENIADLIDMVWPISGGLIGYNDKEDYKDDPETYDLRPRVNMQWIESVTPAQVRGKVRITRPKMVRVICGTFLDNGIWDAQYYIMGLTGNKWLPLDIGMEHERQTSVFMTPYYSTRRGGDIEWVNKVINGVANELFASRYQWQVAFGLPTTDPRILLPTNPSAALKLFRDREAAQKMGRKSALKHWVEHHYRDDTDLGITYIRDHLRGNTVFKWSDFDCELLVSAYDLEKNEAFKLEAANWRAARKHNKSHVKVKFKKGRS